MIEHQLNTKILENLATHIPPMEHVQMNRVATNIPPMQHACIKWDCIWYVICVVDMRIVNKQTGSSWAAGHFSFHPEFTSRIRDVPKANLEFCCVLLINIQTHVATVDIVLVSRGEPRTKCWCSRFGRLASQQWKQAILSHSQGRGNRPSFADGTSSVSIGSSQTVTPKSPLTIKRYQKSHFQEGLSNKA